MRAFQRRGNADCGRRRRVARGVGEQVVQHLRDAPPVGHHVGQAGRQVRDHGLAAAGAGEGVAGALDQACHGRRLGSHRQRARLDAAGVQQVADEAAHVIRLLVDDAGKLAHLRGLEVGAFAQQRGGGTLDGGERRAQLVAYQAQELGAHAFHFVERREVLQGDHHRPRDTPFRGDGGGVDQGAHAAPVRYRQHHLLGAHGLGVGVCELVGQWKVRKRGLAAVRAAAGDDFEELFRRMPRHAEALDDAPHLPVERHWPSAAVEHHHTHRRSLHERLEVGPRKPLGAIHARVGDRGGSLGGEQQQRLFVVVAELDAAGLVGKEEVSDVDAAIVHRRALERPGKRRGGCEPQGTDIVREVRYPQRSGQFTQVLEEAAPVGPRSEFDLFFRRESAGDELLRTAVVIDGGNHSGAGAGKGTGAVDRLPQHRVEVEARAHAQYRIGQRGDPVAGVFFR